MTLLHDVLWVEKYRPTKLEDLALDPENAQVLSSYLEAGEIPHLLLAGPPGTGKTTVARIFCKNLNCRVLSLNASTDRGIDVVRERIGNFVTGMSSKQWNVVFLDEADAMTADAQTAMRNLIESYASVARFILTANYLYKIIGPIQSRCQVLTLSRPPLKERFRILQQVLVAEKITSDMQTTLSYAERYPDMRKMLMSAQRSYIANKGVLPLAVEEGGVGGTELLALVQNKNFAGVRKVSTASGFDAAQSLRDLFWAIPDDHRKVGFLRHIIGKAIHEAGFSPDPVVHFLGTLAEAMEGM